MATTVTFRACGLYVRDAYKTSNDAHRLSADEKNEILSYSNISKEFSVRDWYGGYTDIKAILTSVEENEWGDLMFNIKVNRNINKDYCPSPSDILKGRNMLYPIGYCRV